MKKLALFAVLASLAMLVSAANAEVQTNVKVPIAQTVFVPCANGGAGENVDLEGPLHVLITLTINDNHVSGKAHYQPQGVKGVGQDTGDVYKATGVTQDQFSGSLVNGQFTETFINNFRIIGPGKDNNLLIHGTSHVTVNANGDVTVLVDLLSIECK
jgi:hypothetical protein